MEFMPDGCLYELLHVKDDIQLTDEVKKSMIRQLAGGLAYLHHDAKLAHNDLKPQNILVDMQDSAAGGLVVVVKITDFGLSKMKTDTESTATSPKTVQNIGTPRYSAPELLRGELVPVRELQMCDVYSMGLIVYEIWSECESFPDLNQLQ